MAQTPAEDEGARPAGEPWARYWDRTTAFAENLAQVQRRLHTGELTRPQAGRWVAAQQRQLAVHLGDVYRARARAEGLRKGMLFTLCVLAPALDGLPDERRRALQPQWEAGLDRARASVRAARRVQFYTQEVDTDYLVLRDELCEGAPPC